MRWDYKYPTVQVDEGTRDSCLWHSGVIGKCFMCGNRTSWVDLCFDAHLCSEECEREALEDMARRMQEADKLVDPSF